jgi:chitin disaccharide deacetylase
MNIKSVFSTFFFILLLVSVLYYPVFANTGSAIISDSPDLLIRIDDLGMSHSVNAAAKEFFETGIPVSASVMFACPWYQEAVEILQQYPDVAVGIHLTLNSEWKYYKWGPVSGRTAVPTLVDGDGHFFPTRVDFFGNEPDLGEVEMELRAQIERALGSGLRIDYLDFHMGTAVSTPEIREVTERLAGEYGLAISADYIQSYDNGIYAVPVEEKQDSLISLIRHLHPGEKRLLVSHVALDTPEMSVLVDLNSHGLTEMSKHREAELRALTSTAFRETLRRYNVRLITYRDLLGN